MSHDGWRSVLVLGGIRSGKSEFAEALVRDAARVRYVATASSGTDDPEWTARIAAHQRRRRAEWTTHEVGATPRRLATLIAEAKPDETLLVDDLGGWVAARLADEPSDEPAVEPADRADGAAVAAGPDTGAEPVTRAEPAAPADPTAPAGPDVPGTDPVRVLAAAVRGCAARLVLVSSEVGLSLVPTNSVGRAFTDALGDTNQAVAEACDAVVLVVAGQATWLKRGIAVEPAVAAPAPPHDTAPPDTAPPDTAPRVVDLARNDLARVAHTGAVTPPDIAPPAAPPHTAPPDIAPPDTAPPAAAPPTAHTAATAAATVTATVDGPVAATGPEIRPGMRLPAPDESAATAALARLAGLDLAGAGFGELARVVAFAAGAQASAAPRPWRCPYLLVLHGEHAGGAAAGAIPGESSRRAALAREGAGPLGILAARAGATVRVVRAPPARPMELGPALEAGEVDDAMRRGWLLAEEAIDAGADVLVIGSCGSGTDAAAAAVLAATAGAEVAAVLPRAIAPGARIDDDAWMVRCAAARDALYRIRHTARGAHEGMADHSLSRLVHRRRNPRGAHYLLAELGGGDMAVATGVVLGAAARRTPVLVDGPVGVVAVLASRDLAGQARHWCLLADHGQNPIVTFAARVLELSPLTDLRLDLGEGATALATLPLLGAALELAATLPAHPAAPAETAATEPAAPAETAETAPAQTKPAETELAETELAASEPAATGDGAGADRDRPPRG